MNQPIQVFEGDGQRKVGDLKLPPLYYRSKTKALHVWSVWTNLATIYTEYGQVDGAKQTSTKVAAATNVGRSNERDAVAQAEFEAKALWQHKVTRRYREDPAEAEVEEIIMPMLAHDGKKSKRLTPPFDAQVKFDGFRCMASWEGEEIRLMSRNGRSYDVPHIVARLKQIMPKGYMLDGEIYAHGIPFQTVTSLIKRPQLGSGALSYHAYDCPMAPEYNGANAPWVVRRQVLFRLLTRERPPWEGEDPVKYVAHVTVTDMAQVKPLHDEIVQNGFEGLIFRLWEGQYEFARRSNFLLKWKEFDDGEFKIVGVKEGIGKMAGHAIFVCENDLTNVFNTVDVVCRGTMAQRQQWWVDRDKMLGQYLTIRFFGRSEPDLDAKGQPIPNTGQLPRFPVGVGIRPPEDSPVATNPDKDDA